MVYKRRWCMNAGSECPRGALCAFAHTRAELQEWTSVYTEQEEARQDEQFFMHRYKTCWCPLPGVHYWDSCPYAHTKRDVRRVPLAGYSSKRCPEWERALKSEPADGPPLPYSA